LLQVVFHAQLAKERGAFDFDAVCQRIVDKLIARHPHVFGKQRLRTADAVVAQWEHLKRAEKKGTRHERPSALDGIPKHLPALLRAEKLLKKARKAKLVSNRQTDKKRTSKRALAQKLFKMAEQAQRRGWSAEDLLRRETHRAERALRKRERLRAKLN
jgi:uncharacterized protein YabN with tetrapyrrole methylase and pyrophosphatase domain